jgi:eukaryotic-like serine/threonine-protein kinase
MKILSAGDLVFDRYQVIEFVGEGGMQEVYRAMDLAFDRMVALKTPKNDHALKRFEQSARTSASVRHPSVADTLDYFEYEDRAFLVEEFIEGVDLKQVMAETYSYLDPALAAHLSVHIAKGLRACHDRGVWHRDLKPANIMVSRDLSFNEVKITDFGIAKLVAEEFPKDDTAAESSITASSTLLGAVPYMAPEHMFTPSKADRRADIWSFGAVLYSLLTGAPPFGRSFPNIAAAYSQGAHYEAPPPWMLGKAQFNEPFQQLWGVIQRCLIVDREKRPTADELVRSLADICFSVYPRERGRTKSTMLYNGSVSFISTDTKDAQYHIDSFYAEGKLAGGVPVAFSRHPGQPSERAFPVVPLRAIAT